jgi:hypothetical protein
MLLGCRLGLAGPNTFFLKRPNTVICPIFLGGFKNKDLDHLLLDQLDDFFLDFDMKVL